MARKANEIPRLELLERDVLVLFKEVRRLRAENERLIEQNSLLATENKSLKEGIPFSEKEELGYYIKSQRMALGLKQVEAAALFHVTPQTLSNYECGKGSLENMKGLVKTIRKIRRAKRK